MREKIYSVREFRGLQESPDGDTGLLPGEASVMKNFTVSREGSLCKRPGTRCLLRLGTEPVKAMWQGRVAGEEGLYCAQGGKLWKLSASGDDLQGEALGELDCSAVPQLFGFSDKLYILTGSEYKCFDGQSLSDAEGYVPLVLVSLTPEGGGESLEGINRLSSERRAWLSPDGSGREFTLPDKDIAGVEYVKKLSDGSLLPPEFWEFSPDSGKLSFTAAPEQGVNSLEVCWDSGHCSRETVERMRWAEIYNGFQDSRVFLCGDGSGRCIYSGLGENGAPRADYFPELNEICPGESNSPVTGLIRHHSQLLCFKEDSLWCIDAGTAEGPESGVRTAFYCRPVNRSMGNAAPGQLRLVMNSPRSLWGGGLYSWQSGAGAASEQMREAVMISGGICRSLSEFDFSRCLCFDDAPAREYYICCGDRALVENYARGAWYSIEGPDIRAMLRRRGRLLIGSGDGKILEMGRQYSSDEGRAIDCLWESGSMDLGEEHMEKYSGALYLGIKPQARAEISASVITDRQSGGAEKTLRTRLMSFADASFASWSFSTAREARIKKLRLRARRFVYYRLRLMSCSADSTAVVLSAGIRLRCTGRAG